MQLDGIVKALGHGGYHGKARTVMKGIDASVTKLTDWISPSLAVEVATKRIKAGDKQHLVRTVWIVYSMNYARTVTHNHAQSLVMMLIALSLSPTIACC